MLYLRAPNLKADPKVISRRASYLPVRLAFHRYPQVIQKFFNIYWFGPPRNVTYASSCSWIDHWVSGLIKQTKRPIKARFHYGSNAEHFNLACLINSLAHYAKGTPSHPKMLRLLVGVWFQVYFTPLIGVLFTFPSRYLFTIGH